MANHEKTVWKKVTMMIPEPWAKRLQEITGITGAPQTHIVREAIQVGLPIIAQQMDERRAWVLGKIGREVREDKTILEAPPSGRGKKVSSRKPSRPAAGSPGRRRRTR